MANNDTSRVIDKKISKLRRILEKAGKVVVAFSGGTDSTFLAAAAYEALGDNSAAVTAISPSLAAE